MQLQEDKGTKGLVYANKFMLIARQSQPDSPDGKMAGFGFCAAPSLIWGEGGRGGGWEFAVPFHSVQESKIATLGASLCA